LSPEERLELASKLFWGLAEKAPQRGESPLLIRRAAVAARDLAKGERASIPNVAYLRPPGNLPSAPLGPAAEPPPTLLRAVPKGAVILEADVERPACR
jgi:hypothetical protein